MQNYEMIQIYPNPFNLATTISFSLPTAEKVNMSISDLSGRLVRTVLNDWRDTGYHEVTFDGSNLTSGIYLVRMEAGSWADVRKLVLVK